MSVWSRLAGKAGLLVVGMALAVAGCTGEETKGAKQRSAASAPAAGEHFAPFEGQPHGQTADAESTHVVMDRAKPADFPTDIPIYPGSTVVLGGKSTSARPSWTLTVATTDSRATATDRYEKLLTRFERVTDLDMGDSALSIWRNAAYDMTVMTGTGTDGKTTITLNVASK